ncbi:hypothetical protein LNP74_33580 [Klebsiella pneumoniae subsp. pneumoniae]|nr:hypothetical protein [Klebsiella pneumoniae subsp. pneumoniae]
MARRLTRRSGGDIVVTYQNDVATLDPAIGYDWQKLVDDQKPVRRPGWTIVPAPPSW